jgi:Zn-dependent protease
MLILRVAVAASLHMNPSGHFAVHPNIPAFIALATLSGSLALGFFTPLVSLLAGIAEVAVLLTGAATVVAAALLGPLDAVVLLLLGPGAYSLDARLFGRRVVVLQPAPAPVERR